MGHHYLIQWFVKCTAANHCTERYGIFVDWATFREKFLRKHIQFESENRHPSVIWKWRAFVPVFMCQTVLSHHLAHGIYIKNVPANFVMRKLAARSYIIHFASCKCKFAIGWPILPKRKWGFPQPWPMLLDTWAGVWVRLIMAFVKLRCFHTPFRWYRCYNYQLILCHRTSPVTQLTLTSACLIIKHWEVGI